MGNIKNFITIKTILLLSYWLCCLIFDVDKWLERILHANLPPLRKANFLFFFSRSGVKEGKYLFVSLNTKLDIWFSFLNF